MKKSIIIIIVSLLLSNIIYSQVWNSNLPKVKNNNELKFQDYQKAFNNHWKGKDIVNGYYIENNKKKKAYGWKQYKRWEYFWESRVNSENGNFPSNSQYKTALIQYKESEKIRDKVETRDALPNSTNGNWTNLGPKSSSGGYAGVGRINQIAFHPNDKKTFWVSTPHGGLWMTTNSGSSWIPLTDKLDVLTTTAIAIPSNYATSNTLYIGTGDAYNDQHKDGVGVLRSINGGASWNSTGLTFNLGDGVSVNRLLIHPNNNNIIYAATTKGIYKTTDAASTWIKIYSENIIDMEFNLSNPSIIYASNFNFGKIYKLTNDGTNSSIIYDNYDGSRIELAVSPDKPSQLFALIVNNDGGLKEIIRYNNSDEVFSVIYAPSTPASPSKPNMLSYKEDGAEEGGFGSYALSFSINPNDADIIYVGCINTWKSTNGGSSFSLSNHWYGGGGKAAVHADKHALIFNGNTIYECNDGGLYRSNNGENWDNISNGIINSQIYKLGISQSSKNDILIGLQDNGSKAYNSGNWKDINGGDGMECLIDYSNSDIQYVENQYGALTKTTDNWYTSDEIQPPNTEGAWVTPFIIDPNDHNTLYAGYRNIYKTTNNGDSWSIIYNLNSEKKFRAIAIAASDSKVIYASEPNVIWKTTNGGTSWTNITSNLPNSQITSIAVKHDDPTTVWITFGEFNSHVIYQTTNGGTSWTNISSGLPNIPANSVIQNKQNTSNTELYIGTDFGVYIKLGSSNWKLFNLGLPKVVVSELEIYYNSTPSSSKIRAATYGRGLWESDLYSNQQVTGGSATATSDYICKGTSTTLSLNGYQGDIQWQESINGAANWNNVSGGSGANTDKYTTTKMTTAKYFRAKVSRGSSAAYSNNVHIQLYPNFDFTEKEIVCFGDEYTFPDGTVESNITSQVIHTSNFATTNGCDSIITTILDVITIDTSVTKTGNTLIANAVNLRYQWIDCDSNYSYIDGETNQSFTPTSSGNYAVILEDSICFNFSLCHNVTISRVNNLSKNSISIYPNPTRNKLIIDFTQFETSEAQIEIIDISGKVVMKLFKNPNKKIKHIDINDLNSGLYTIKIFIGTRALYDKLIIRKIVVL